MLLTFPLMVAIQMVSALIGRVTGRGLAYNMGQVIAALCRNGPAVLLVYRQPPLTWARTWRRWAKRQSWSPAINQHAFTIGFAVLSLGLQLFIPYRRYARLLTVLTFSLSPMSRSCSCCHWTGKAIGAGLIGLHHPN